MSVHLLKTRGGALCGTFDGATSADINNVTCEVCIRMHNNPPTTRQSTADRSVTYDIDDLASMSPGELADVLAEVASLNEETAGELECKHKPDTAKQCRRLAGILTSACGLLRKLEGK